MKWSGGAVETLPHQYNGGKIMYARSTTIQGQPQSIRRRYRTYARQRDARARGHRLAVSVRLLVGRPNVRPLHCYQLRQFEEAMRASEESIRPIRDRAAELLGGSRQVEESEIAADAS